jgi:hypothetical protein
MHPKISVVNPTKLAAALSLILLGIPAIILIALSKDEF